MNINRLDIEAHEMRKSLLKKYLNEANEGLEKTKLDYSNATRQLNARFRTEFRKTEQYLLCLEALLSKECSTRRTIGIWFKKLLIFIKR